MSQIAKRAELELKLCEYQRSLVPKCQVCDEYRHLELHHILRRGIFQNKKIIDLMPIVFHALICSSCNANDGPFIVDAPTGRVKLLVQSAEMYGLDRVIDGFDEWDSIVPNGFNPEIVDLDDVIEVYNKKTWR